jgi:ubiquinone/menaquinone biosynthesis C-methylase UbiE
VLDVGGGAGHQSFPLAQAGYEVTLLDPSPAMLDQARQRLQRLPEEAQRRVNFVQADGENADEAVQGRRFAAVLCHGVLGYLERPGPVLDQLCRCAADGCVVSIMAGNAEAAAVRPALERRWADALIEVTLVDSRTDPRVQVADLLARAARRVATDHLAGRPQPDGDLTALLRAAVDPESAWADARSWAAQSPTARR